MNFRKASIATAAAAVLALTATACGGDSGSGSDTESGSDGGTKYTVGIKFDQPGLGLKEPDGSYSGFDVDVANYVAKELGAKEGDVEFKQTQSADRETNLQNGDVDFIVASYSITPEREAKVDFAGPYFLAHQDLLVRKGENITEGADLNGKKLCSVAGSTSAQNVKDSIAPDAQLEERGGYSECLAAVSGGSIDALTTDDSILAGYAAQKENAGKFQLAGLKLSNENYGIGVKKGSDLKSKINKALEKMVEDGTWDKAVKDNFGASGYKNEPAPKIGDVVK